uniref:Phosphodiesterase n=1 Tax=Globisporangium ultimum (strain ATCC 200006 / CBS 805.95 / DAOM BR144) TaxID=431595 RepID=K3XBL4_GLOUD
MIEQPPFLSRTSSAFLLASAAASSASVAAISTSSNSSSSSGSATTDDGEVASITSFHIVERKREEAFLPSPIEDERDDSDRKYELKIGIAHTVSIKNEALLSTTSSSSSSIGSTEKQRESSASSASTMSSSSTVVSSRLHARVKALTNYLFNNFSGLRKRVAATNPTGSVADVGRMRHYLRRSAPDGTDRPKFNVLSTRHSGSELHTTLSWEDTDSDDVMYSTPKSRKRVRPADFLQDAAVRELCHQCDVRKSRTDQVVKIVTTGFGTTELDLLMLEALIPENVVVFVGMLVFQSLECAREFIDFKVLPKFLRHVQDRYRRDMPFHNAAHAADVLHSLFMMLSSTGLGEKISSHNQVGALLAAVMHDIEHSGLTNDFLIKTNHEIAQQFPTRAPMESKHIALALEAISNPKFNILTKMNAKQQAEVLTVVRETILATALCYQRELLDEVQAVSDEDWYKTEVHSDEEVLIQPLQILSLRCAMHVSDISQTMKPFTQHQKWVSRLTAEHFIQGVEDKRLAAGVSPPCCFEETWTQRDFLLSQTGFLQNLALPAVATLNVIPWLDIGALVDGVKNNIVEWNKEDDL